MTFRIMTCNFCKEKFRNKQLAKLHLVQKHLDETFQTSYLNKVIR
jgi:hypothetical protein